MQILGLFVFSKDGQVRHQQFFPGRTNIVSGAPGTGKSTILQIIDHCLGGANGVPARIRKVVSWYGLIIQTLESQVLIAKPEITGVTSTTEAFVSVATRVDLPNFEELIVNSNDVAIRELLNGMLGISSADIELKKESTRTSYDVTLRHALRLSLQPQGEITRNDILFHDQANHFVELNIRDTLPVFLGLVSPERLFLSRRLRRIEGETISLQREFQLLENSSPANKAMLDALVIEAEDIGLIASQNPLNNDTEKLNMLREVARGADAAGIESGSIESSLRGLRDERNELLEQYRNLRDQYGFLQSFGSVRDEYTDFVTLQVERGEAIGLFSGSDPSVCPLCGNEIVVEHLDELAKSIDDLKKNVGKIKSGRERYEQALLSYADRIDEIRFKLKENQRSIALATEAMDKRIENQSLQTKQNLVRGRISFFCDAAEGSELQTLHEERLKTLREEARKIEIELSSGFQEEKQEGVLAEIGNRMTEIGARLIFEYTNFGLFFDLKHLTAGAKTKDGPETLREIGSAANWLAFHVITHLALHDWFIKKNRPTLRFLILDQPTQAYYPPDAQVQAADLSDIKDEDRRAVAALFNVLFQFPALYDGEFQIIVLDHAELNTPEFHQSVVARWRDGEALIPNAWFKRYDA